MSVRLGSSEGSHWASENRLSGQKLASEPLTEGDTFLGIAGSVNKLAQSDRVSTIGSAFNEENPPGVLSRLWTHVKTNVKSLAARATGAATAIGTGIAMAYHAMYVPNVTLASLGGMVMGPLAALHMVTESVALVHKLRKLGAPPREIVGRVLLEAVLPSVAGFFASAGMVAGSVAGAVMSGGVGTPMIGVAVLKAASMYFLVRTASSLIGKRLADWMFGSREEHTHWVGDVASNTLYSLRPKRERPAHDLESLDDGDSDDGEDVFRLARLQHNDEDGVSPEFEAAINRPANTVNAGRPGQKWFEQDDLSALKTMTEDGTEQARPKLVTLNPAAALRLPEEKALRNVYGGGSCWVTASNYAFLTHFKSMDPQARTRIIDGIRTKAPNDTGYVAMLGEISANADQLSDDQIMSLITSPQYWPVVEGFTREVAKLPEKDAPGDVTHIGAFGNYVGAQLSQISITDVGGQAISDATPLSEGAQVAKQLVFVAPNPPSTIGHYLVLEDREQDDDDDSTANLPSALSRSFHSAHS